jgi:hypothetical protein
MFEPGKVKFTLDFKLTKAKIAFALAVFVITVFPFSLGSEYMVLQAYYPVPSGYMDRLSALVLNMGTYSSVAGSDYSVSISSVPPISSATGGNLAGATPAAGTYLSPLFVSTVTMSFGGGYSTTANTTMNAYASYIVPRDIGSQTYLADFCTWIYISGGVSATTCSNQSGEWANSTPIAIARIGPDSTSVSATGISADSTGLQSYMLLGFSTPTSMNTSNGAGLGQYVLCCKVANA